MVSSRAHVVCVSNMYICAHQPPARIMIDRLISKIVKSYDKTNEIIMLSHNFETFFFTSRENISMTQAKRWFCYVSSFDHEKICDCHYCTHSPFPHLTRFNAEQKLAHFFLFEGFTHNAQTHTIFHKQKTMSNSSYVMHIFN